MNAIKRRAAMSWAWSVIKTHSSHRNNQLEFARDGGVRWGYGDCSVGSLTSFRTKMGKHCGFGGGQRD